ncbi:calcium/proton exchanger [Tanacetum coccineum]
MVKTGLLKTNDFLIPFDEHLAIIRGQPKKKKAKNVVFTVYFKYDGIFTSWPLKYAQGEMKEVNDTNFDEISYEDLLEIVKRLVPRGSFEKVYYCQTGVTLSLGIREIKSDQDIVDMLKVGYDNGNEIDMFVEHFGYDIMEMVEFEVNDEKNENMIDYSDDNYSSDDCVEIENVDFQRVMIMLMSDINETQEIDLGDNQIDSVYKVQIEVVYPTFDPNILWDKMEPMLGKKGNKDRLMPNKVRTGVSKGKRGKKVVKNKKIKSLISEHKCCKNYNLGSLVTYKWIAMKYCKEIIDDPCMPLKKIKDDIRQKFMIDVSLRQCRRAKQLALFYHEGGLIEHYGKLYHYRQALLDSNPGSTCRLDVDESANGFVYFKRMYICFKGVKDGWLTGCRKGWFLHLLHDDLSLNEGNGITIILDSHKGLLDVMLPELEVRKGDQSYGVNLQNKACACRIWKLSGVPCVHVVAAYMHVGTDLDGWWKFCRGDGSGDRSSEMGGCDGIGDGSGGSASGIGGSGGIGDGSGRTNSKGGGRGRRGGGMASRGGGRGSRGGGSRRGGGMAGSSSMGAKTITLDGVLTDEESLEEAPYNQQYHGILVPHIHSQPTQQSGVWVVDTTITTAYIEEAQAMETSDTTKVGEEAQAVKTSDTIDKGNASASVDEGKTPITVEDEPAPKRKRGRPPSHVDAIRIYHKNRGRSERIANMKLK